MTYIKMHDPWDSTCLRSAEAMNHIESQWTVIKADIDLHNHDTRYYTKTSSDATFFSTAFYTGFDADMIDGSHFADLVSSILPVGAVMIWHSTDATVPSNWAICNGGSGTPDLRNLFVIGSGGSYDIGDTGGSLATKAITGTITIDSHILVGDEIPLHTHTYNDIYDSTYQGGYDIKGAVNAGTLNNTSRTTDSAGGSGGHGHAGSTISLSNIAVIPAYYAAYYIMKVA